MDVYREVLDTPIGLAYDVVVAGGGAAGFAAALNAARNGARTVLIEREFMLGGTMTAGLMAKIAIEPYMTGIPTEFMMRLGQRRMAIPYSGFPAPWPPSEMTEVPVDPEACKLLAEEMLTEAGVRVLYGTQVAGVMQDEGRLQGVVVENKSGRSVIPGKVFIDATGDGDLCARAGAAFEFGMAGNGRCSAANMLSRVAGVDLARTIDYLEAHPGELTRKKRRGTEGDDITPALLRDYALSDQPQFVSIGNFDETVARLLADPAVSEWEKNMLRLRNGIAFMNTPVRGQVLLNVGRVTGADPLDALSLSDAVIESRRQNWYAYQFLRENIPGFENAALIETGAMLGVRESRRVVCDYQHTLEDFKARVRFEDAILRNNDSVEFHNPDGSGIIFELYDPGEYEEISYRSILVKEWENLLVAGRCWSADQMALSANRSIGFCMGMGQAAGMAAALAVRDGVMLRQIDVKELQRAVYPLKEG